MTVLTWLTGQAGGLLLGSTVLLGLGALAVALHRDPIHRQRLGELTLGGTMLWLLLAVVPLPRPGADLAAVTTPASTRPAPVLEVPDTAVEDDVGAASAGGDAGLERAAAVSPRERPDARRVVARPLVGPPAELASVGHALLPAQDLLLVVLQDAPASPAVDAPTGPLAVPPAVRPAVPPAATPLTLGETLALVALGVSAAAALYLLMGALRLRRLLRTAEPAGPELVELARSLSPSGALPRLLVTRGSSGPFCVGLWRPAVVLPAALLQERPEAVPHVLAHELAHARQGDGRGQLLVALALPLLWFHPLAWWLRRQVRLSSELVADDLAAGTVHRTRYARQLLGLMEAGWGRAPTPVAAPPIFRSTHEFTRRIEMLLRRTRPLATRCSSARRRLQGVVAVALVAVATCAWGTPAAAQSADADRDRLMQERAELMDQLANMRAQLSDLQMALERTRADAEHARAEAVRSADRIAERDRDLADTRDALNRRQMDMSVALQNAEAARRQAEMMAEHAAMERQRAEMVLAEREARMHEQQMQLEEQRRQNERQRDAFMQQDGRRPAGGEGDLYTPRADLFAGAAPSGDVTLSESTLDLVTRFIDIQGELEIVMTGLAHNEALFRDGLVSDTQLHQDRVNIRTLERKAELMRSLIMAELRATEADLKRGSDLSPNHPQYDHGRRMRLEARMEILASALGSGSSRGKRERDEGEGRGR